MNLWIVLVFAAENGSQGKYRKLQAFIPTENNSPQIHLQEPMNFLVFLECLCRKGLNTALLCTSPGPVSRENDCADLAHFNELAILYEHGSSIHHVTQYQT